MLRRGLSALASSRKSPVRTFFHISPRYLGATFLPSVLQMVPAKRENGFYKGEKKILLAYAVRQPSFPPRPLGESRHVGLPAGVALYT